MKKNVSQLQSLLRDHTTFIMGFHEGQELAARAAALRLLEVERVELARRARSVLTPMLDTSSLLAQQARTLIKAIDRALEAIDEATYALIGAGVATATHSIIAFGRALAPYAGGAAVVAGLTGVNMATLSGDPKAEALRAALSYLAHNANALTAFAVHDAQLKVWLDWLISKIKSSRRRAVRARACCSFAATRVTLDFGPFTFCSILAHEGASPRRALKRALRLLFDK